MITNKIKSLRAYAKAASFRSMGKIAATSLLATVLSIGTARGAPGGELDASFGENGRLTIQEASFGGAALRQPDGKILLTGSSGLGFDVIRLHPDGSLDDSFGTDGTVIIDFGGFGDVATELAIQPDGKIVVAGDSYVDAGNSDFALVRLDPDGTIDATFGGGGLVTLGLGGTYESIRGLLLLQNGQLVITGVTNENGNSDIAFARFDADGRLDTTFGNGPIAGTTLIDASTTGDPFRNDEPFSITRQLDGKFVACGVADTDYWDYFGTMVAVRVHPDGSLDTGFGSNGISLIAESARAQTCMAMPDGTILLAGYRIGFDVAFARLTPDGMKDATFGNLGFSTFDLGGSELLHSMIPLSDGNLGVIGLISTVRDNVFGIPTDMFIGRVDPHSGLLDPGFGNNGVTIVDFGHANRSAYSEGRRLVQQADGKLVAVGTGTSGVALARVDPAGTGNAGFAGFAYTSASVTEGADELVLSVRRTGGSTGELSVDYNTVANTAMTPADFTASFGTLDWTSGDMEPKSISVLITDDGIEENNEDFTIVLSNSKGGLAASEFVVTIMDKVASPPPPPAPPSNTGSGGGGGTGIELLMLLAMSRAFATYRRRGEGSGE